MIEVYGISDVDRNYYNRVHKDLRQLSQNTAVYKTRKLAEKEITDIKEKLLKKQAIKSGYCKKNDYKALREYLWEHRNDIMLFVNSIYIGEDI